jgi:hypothetical protein
MDLDYIHISLKCSLIVYTFNSTVLWLANLKGGNRIRFGNNLKSRIRIRIRNTGLKFAFLCAQTATSSRGTARSGSASWGTRGSSATHRQTSPGTLTYGLPDPVFLYVDSDPVVKF